MRLNELLKGGRGRVIGHADESVLSQRLLEMGFIYGTKVEVLHEGPFGKDPMAVRVRGSVVAIRRDEAKMIEIEIEGKSNR